MMSHVSNSTGAMPEVPYKTAIGGDRGAVHEPDLPWLTARRAHAFSVGEQLALARIVSADSYLFLYKELVRLCKDRTFCWAGLQWFAERLNTSLGTIKRWVEELVAAGLIRRSPRPGGQTALTTIPALEAFDASPRIPEQPSAAARDEAHVWVKCGPIVLPEVDIRDGVEELNPGAPLFFVPTQQISSESCGGTKMSRHTIKKPNLNKVGCGVEPVIELQSQAVLATTRLLKQVGVVDINVLRELESEPAVELDAIIHYVSRQRNATNPPGLVVALAREKFGAQLLRPQATKSWLQPEKESLIGTSHTPSVGSPRAAGLLASVERSPEVSPVWQSVLQRVQAEIPASEFETWLKQTRLLLLEKDLVIVGTPNTFVRQEVEERYTGLLQEVLQDELDRPVYIKVVIDP